MTAYGKNTVITANVIGDTTTIYGTNNTLFIAHSAVLYADTDGIDINGQANTAVIRGEVNGGLAGVAASPAGGSESTQNNQSISIDRSGSVYGGYEGVLLDGGHNSLINFGAIAAGNTGVLSYNLSGTANTISNYGTIAGDAPNGFALHATGGDLIVTNAGTLHGAVAAVGLALDNLAAGLIVGTVTTGLDATTITNRGTIDGGVNLGAGGGTIANTGLITGNITVGGGAALIDNSHGTIDGTLTFGSANDTFRPGAGIEHADGGAGSDTLDFSAGGALTLALDDSLVATGWAEGDSYSGFENVIGSISGGNTLVGDEHDNTLTGGKSADSLVGNDGNDTLSGGGGKDSLDGGAGNDTLYGGDGRDTLSGGAGADKLYGGAGNDILDGGNGPDKLFGGGGADILIGGAGADVFVFARGDIPGSGPTDEIRDFSHADGDRINLSAFGTDSKTAGHQPLIFIGDAAFDGHAGELHFVKNPDLAVWQLEGDTNGDGKSDFTIWLDGVASLVAADLIL